MSFIANILVVEKQKLKRKIRILRKEVSQYKKANERQKTDKKKKKEKELFQGKTRQEIYEEKVEADKGGAKVGKHDIGREYRRRQLKLATYIARLNVIRVIEYALRLFSLIVKAMIYIFGPVLGVVILVAAILIIVMTTLLSRTDLSNTPTDDLTQVEQGVGGNGCGAAWTEEELATRGSLLTDYEKNIYRLVMLSRQFVEGELTGEQIFGADSGLAIYFAVGTSSIESSMRFYLNGANHNILKVPSDIPANDRAPGYALFGISSQETLDTYLNAGQQAILKGLYQPDSTPMYTTNYAPYGINMQMYHLEGKLKDARRHDIKDLAKEVGGKFGIVATIEEFASFAEMCMAQAGYHGISYADGEQHGYLSYWAAFWAASHDDDAKRGMHNIRYKNAGYDEYSIRHLYVGTKQSEIRTVGLHGGPQDLKLSPHFTTRMEINGQVLEETLWAYLDKKYKGVVPEWDKAWEVQQQIARKSSKGARERSLNYTYGPNSFIQGSSIMRDLEAKLTGDVCGGSGTISETGAVIDENTLSNFMKTLLMPVGRVMYSWGGGRSHGPKETGRAPEGIPPEWTAFYDKFQKPNLKYNFRDYRTAGKDATATSRKSGLDCSGLIGWTLGNIRYDGVAYAQYSGDTIGFLVNKKLGKKLPNPNADYRPGDVFANNGHVWIVVGPSEHGGAVIAHASPSGVKLAGIDGGVATAVAYMEKYFPEVSDLSRAFNFETFNVSSYKTGYQQFRFNIVEAGNRDGLEDAEGVYNMTGEQILQQIYGGI